jgi:hypothetical protein
MQFCRRAAEMEKPRRGLEDAQLLERRALQ